MMVIGADIDEQIPPDVSVAWGSNDYTEADDE